MAEAFPFTKCLGKGDEEKDEMQGAQSPRNRSNLLGCEDFEGFCNEAGRFFFAPSFLFCGMTDNLNVDVIDLIALKTLL